MKKKCVLLVLMVAGCAEVDGGDVDAAVEAGASRACSAVALQGATLSKAVAADGGSARAAKSNLRDKLWGRELAAVVSDDRRERALTRVIDDLVNKATVSCGDRN